MSERVIVKNGLGLAIDTNESHRCSNLSNSDSLQKNTHSTASFLHEKTTTKKQTKNPNEKPSGQARNSRKIIRQVKQKHPGALSRINFGSKRGYRNTSRKGLKPRFIHGDEKLFFPTTAKHVIKISKRNTCSNKIPCRDLIVGNLVLLIRFCTVLLNSQSAHLHGHFARDSKTKLESDDVQWESVRSL